MSSKLYPSDIWRLGDALSPVEKLVALALLDYGDRIYPSQSHVALKTGLSLATVKRVMRSLRGKMVVSAKRNRKGLVYAFVMAHPDTSEGVTVTPQKCHRDTGSVSQRATNYPKNSPTNQNAADAAGGWEVPEELQERIRQRDPRAEFVAQARVCRRILAQHGLTLEEAKREWRRLCVAWATTGNNAYELLAPKTLGLEEARSPRGLLLHRLREVAA